MKTITLYARNHCSLCDKAKKVIETLQATHPCELRVVDIDHEMDPSDPRRSRFGIDVPVVELEGTIVFKHVVDPTALGKLLAEPGVP